LQYTQNIAQFICTELTRLNTGPVIISDCHIAYLRGKLDIKIAMNLHYYRNCYLHF